MKCFALGVLALVTVSGCIIQHPTYPTRRYRSSASPAYSVGPAYGTPPDTRSGDAEAPPPGQSGPMEPSREDDGVADRSYRTSAGPPENPVPEIGPRSVRVSILGALIAPSKTDGRQWDGPGRITPSSMSQLARSLGAPHPYAAALAVVASISMDALAKPDVYGTAQLFAPSEISRIPLPMLYRDTFTPSWPNAEFSEVPLRPGVRIRVTLIDKDLADDDPIGTVELTLEDLHAALQAGNVYPVQVAAQSANQLLFLNISVAPE